MADDLISLSFTIEPQAAGDAAAIEDLLDRAFGPDRHGRTAYRLRDGVAPVEALSLVARDGHRFLGTLRFWPVEIAPEDGGDNVSALLLGPLAVAPDLKGKGIGITLMREGLARAREAGHRAVILVGDFDYYRRVGFVRMAPGQFTMPGPVDEARLLYLELAPGSLAGVSGRIVPARPRDA